LAKLIENPGQNIFPREKPFDRFIKPSTLAPRYVPHVPVIIHPMRMIPAR
jgi:hypothetical protein